MEIYQPAEDSYFFIDFFRRIFKKNKINSYLDMGTGSGILAKTLSKILNPKNIIGADINKTAIKKLEKEKFKRIETDLFKKIKGKFDLITFNAPYLPRDSREPVSSQLATTGGECGDEISLKFMEKAKSHINPNGKIFLLISSLTPQDRLKNSILK